MVKNLAIVFGGNSYEHEISILTAIESMNELSNYNVYPIYIREREFYYGENLFNVKSYKNFDSAKYRKVFFKGNKLYTEKFLKKNKLIAKIDCCLLCTHGGDGEDGSLSGYFRILGIPTTSQSVVGNSVSMSKGITKLLLKGLGIKTPKYIVIDAINGNLEEDILFAEKKLKYPLIIKPSNGGSSIGIKTAKNQLELAEAVDFASKFDSLVVVEEKLNKIEEINISICKMENRIILSDIEKVFTKEEFLTFKDKYLNENPNLGMTGQDRIVPYEVNSIIKDKIVAIATKIYNSLNFSGAIRIDMFLIGEEVMVNEINAIPGSLAHYLYEKKGLSYQDFLIGLIEQAARDWNIDKVNKCYLGEEIFSKLNINK